MCAVAAVRVWLEATRIADGPSPTGYALGQRALGAAQPARRRAGGEACRRARSNGRAHVLGALAWVRVCDGRGVPQRSQYAIMKTLGHTTLAMTARYIRTIPTRAR